MLGGMMGVWWRGAGGVERSGDEPGKIANLTR